MDLEVAIAIQVVHEKGYIEYLGVVLAANTAEEVLNWFSTRVSCQQLLSANMYQPCYETEIA